MTNPSIPHAFRRGQTLALAVTLALPLTASAGGLAGPGWDGPDREDSMFDSITEPDRDSIRDGWIGHWWCRFGLRCGNIVPETPIVLPNEPDAPDEPGTPVVDVPDTPDTPAPIPLPAGGLLLAGALVGLRVAVRGAKG